MTIEASMCIVIIMFVSMTLLSLFEMSGKFYERQNILMDVAREQSVYKTGQEHIEYVVTYDYKSSLMMIKTGGVPCKHKVYIKTWTGYKPGHHKNDLEAKKVYYVTDYESVYHTTKSCSHLKLSVHLISKSALDAALNSDGKAYTLCDKCGRKNQVVNSYYITNEGVRYHTTLSCSGLKRTIYEVTDIQGLSPCSRCG